ncbi:hypothetical protein [Brevundimonas balnearis]|uniref:Uncharacterized protein n=1 Tax=Brevundimonas balnearis TaxID=1572858 RepID=A0ABV6R8I4_9CAUL
MFRVLIPAALLTAVLAFAARTESALPTAAPEAASGVEMTWALTSEGDMAKLTYGVPNSDHLAIMMTCAPGEGVEVYGPLIPASPSLRQAGGVAAIDPLSGELMQDIRLPAGDRVLGAMTEARPLRVVNDMGEPRALPVDRAGAGLAERFLNHCASGRA